MKRVITFLCLAVLVAIPAFAQVNEPSGSVEARVGGVFPQKDDSHDNQFAIGFKVKGYLGRGPVSKKTSFNFSFDYLPLSKEEGPVLSFSEAKLSRHGLLFGPGAGFDVLRISKATVSVNGGLTIYGELKTLSVPGRYGQWQSVCYYRYYFPEHCKSNWSVLGNFGGEVSYVFSNKETFDFFFGVSYSRFTNGKNHLAGRFGTIF